jgi:hypothetical protein
LTSQSTYPPEDDEDTIELELTAKELHHLSRAARRARGSAPGFASRAGKGLRRLWPVALAAALVGVAAAIAWRPNPPRRVMPPLAPTAAISSTPAAVSRLAARVEPPAPQRPPVRVRNPFDAREVFEFPAGTTKAEARQKMTQLLLQRAVDRVYPGPGAEAAPKHRATDN